MVPGDNTLNSLCAIEAMKTLQACESNCDDEEMLKRVFRDYVKFMTTPGSHNDTYAESWHRCIRNSASCFDCDNNKYRPLLKLALIIKFVFNVCS